MTGWSCSAALCFNSHRSAKKTGVSYFRLPRNPEVQKEYKKILKTDGVNWRYGYICNEHWSSGDKMDSNSLPDIACPPSQVPLFEKKLKNLKKKIHNSANPSVKDKDNLKVLTQKLNTIRSLNQASVLSTPPISRPRPRNVRASPSSQPSSVTPVRTRELSKRELKAKLVKVTTEKEKLESDLHHANALISILISEWRDSFSAT